MDSLGGRTVQWTFADGPAAGTRFEHTFLDDDRVQWRILNGPGQGQSRVEKRYAALRLTDNVHAVSYLAESGHTLTVVLNLATGQMVGFASGANDWWPMTGTF